MNIDALIIDALIEAVRLVWLLATFSVGFVVLFGAWLFIIGFTQALTEKK